MRVRDMIDALSKIDPDLPVVTIMGDCDDVYEAPAPEEVFVDKADHPGTWSHERTEHCPVKVIRV